MDTGYDNSVKIPAWELGIYSLKDSTDIHPHTSYTDGSQEIQPSVDEGLEYGLWEKGAIEHGNPVDEDINHLTGFLSDWSDMETYYASPEVFTFKYENLEEMMNSKSDGTLLNNADLDKVREDIATMRRIEAQGEPTKHDLFNYRMIIPHGIELDYNPAIEGSENSQEAVESYEKELVDFLKKAESLNTGFNYVLASSHYVNTPFQPRYVKKEGLFGDMSKEEKRQVLDRYREKEISKIESMSEKLGELEIPRVSQELMDREERKELESFIYGQSSLVNNEFYGDMTDQEIAEMVENGLDTARPGPVVVGAHPTLIERNEELMDVFRSEEDLRTRDEIRGELEDFIYGKEVPGLEEDADLSSLHEGEVSHEFMDELMDVESRELIYPAKSLLEFYKPMVEASEGADNFIYEVNGKGVERQVPSVFWYMLDEQTFGSDAHRPMEGPERSQAYSQENLPGDTRLLTEKWLEQLEADTEEALEERDFVSKEGRRKLEA